MWIFKTIYVFFWFNRGEYRDQLGPSAQGGRARSCWPACMHVCARPGQAGLGWVAGGRGAGLGVCAQLITAMHCTAHVPRAYRDPTLFRAFLPPAGACLPPAWASPLQGSPRRMGTRKAVDPISRGPSQPVPCPLSPGGGRCRVWLSFPPSFPGPNPFLSYTQPGLLP